MPWITWPKQQSPEMCDPGQQLSRTSDSSGNSCRSYCLTMITLICFSIWACNKELCNSQKRNKKNRIEKKPFEEVHDFLKICLWPMFDCQSVILGRWSAKLYYFLSFFRLDFLMRPVEEYIHGLANVAWISFLFMSTCELMHVLYLEFESVD